MSRAAAFSMFTQTESSILCPISMTYAVMPALKSNSAIFKDWAPGLSSAQYDPRLVLFSEKTGLTMGMGMTEKQGGSDVRANTTQATADGSGFAFQTRGSQVVFLRPNVRCVFGSGAVQHGLELLFLAAYLA
jgi:putative acyl-CoA dehydrogenase